MDFMRPQLAPLFIPPVYILPFISLSSLNRFFYRTLSELERRRLYKYQRANTSAITNTSANPPNNPPSWAALKFIEGLLWPPPPLPALPIEALLPWAALPPAPLRM